MVKIKPSPGILSALILPPCSSTIFRQIVSPIPLPSNSAALCKGSKGLKILFRYLGSNPIPLSCMVILQPNSLSSHCTLTMELTSGLWETTNAGCNYCGKYGVNVYGHWSYTVEFRRDTAAKQVCEVPTDHAGQKKCGARHLYHDPKHTSCRPVQ